MAISTSKLNIMNNALRMVGSYHLDADDTTSVTYEIADRAFDDAVNTVFSENVFQYNTFRSYSDGGVATSTLSNAEKPADYWSFRHSLSSSGLFSYNTLVKVTNKEGNRCLDFTLDGSVLPINASEIPIISQDVPYLFTSEKEVHIYYSFIPQLDDVDSVRGNDASRMPPFLARIVTLYMAQSMAIELSGSENRQGILFAQYERALRRARVVEGRSSPAQTYINDGNSQIMGSHYGYGSV
jgi:hypothetical protein